MSSSGSSSEAPFEWVGEPARVEYASARLGDVTYSVGEHAYVRAGPAADGRSYIARIVSLYELPATRTRALRGEWVFRTRDALPAAATSTPSTAPARAQQEAREVFPSSEAFEAPLSCLGAKCLVARRADIADEAAFAAIGPDAFWWESFYDAAAAQFTRTDPTCPAPCAAGAGSALPPPQPPRGLGAAAAPARKERHAHPEASAPSPKRQKALPPPPTPPAATPPSPAAAGAGAGAAGTGAAAAPAGEVVVVQTKGGQKMMLPPGWRSETVKRSGSDGHARADRFFFSPEGKRYRSCTSVQQFLLPLPPGLASPSPQADATSAEPDAATAQQQQQQQQQDGVKQEQPQAADVSNGEANEPPKETKDGGAPGSTQNEQ